MKTKHYLTACLVTLAAAFTAGSARAQSPTIITTAPYVITKPGAYQLATDLIYFGNGSPDDAIIKVNASNVTLDFNGHYISGSSTLKGSNLCGVYANERGNLTIKNGTVAYCQQGIYLTGNNTASSLNINQRVDGMLLSYCWSYGVQLNNARNSDVLNCRVSFIGGSTISGAAYGIECIGQGNTLNNNEITNVAPADPLTYTGFGIDVAGANFSLGNRIANCEVGVRGGKYQLNLTSGCKTAFTQGTDAGLNN